VKKWAVVVALALVIVACVVGFYNRPYGGAPAERSTASPVAAPDTLSEKRLNSDSATGGGGADHQSWDERSSPAVAAFNRERSGFAWLLPQFGADATTLDRIARDDPHAVMSDLLAKARAGDSVATNVLGWLAYQRCYLTGPSKEWVDAQRRDARTLPTDEAAWFVETLGGSARRNAEVLAGCTALGDAMDEVTDRVATRAAAGDPGSQFLMSRIDPTGLESDSFLRQAVRGGFPEAAADWVSGVDHGRIRLSTAEDRRTYEEALRVAASASPRGKSALAYCYFKGCLGTADQAAAVALAREAAREGEVSTIVALGRELAPGYLEPNEADAWRLFGVALQLRGCRASDLSVDWMRRLLADRSIAARNPAAAAGAEELWQRYGAAAREHQGCTG
jgi:hypothetical protein